MTDELRDGDDVSLTWALLFGLASSEPGPGKELGDALGGPSAAILSIVLPRLERDGQRASAVRASSSVHSLVASPSR
jgi:hypothetical protein